MNVVGVITKLPPAHVHINPPTPLRAAIKQGSLLHDCVLRYTVIIGDAAVAIYFTAVLSGATAHLYLTVSSRMSVRKENGFMFLRQDKVSVCAGGYFWQRDVAVSVCGSPFRFDCARSHGGWLMHIKLAATMRSIIALFLSLLLCKIHAASLIEFMLHPYSDLSSNRIRFLDSRSFAGLTNLTHL